MKQMTKKSISLFLLLSLVLFCLTACGGSSSPYSHNSAMKEDAFNENPSAFGAMNSTAAVDDIEINEAEQLNSEQKLIYTSNVNIETKEFDVAENAVRNTVTKMGGYIENTNSYSYSSSCRNSYYKVRIPVSNYREFLTAVCEIGSVTYQSERVEDVTTQYLDVEARLNSLENKMRRLEVLKVEATDLDQLLKIEDQISNTQYQLENYTSQLNYLKNQVSYCTVEINLDEVEVYTEKPSFITELIDANKESIEGFVNFLKELCIIFVYLYPYLIITSLILIAVLCYRKKHRAKKITEKRIPISNKNSISADPNKKE